MLISVGDRGKNRRLLPVPLERGYYRENPAQEPPPSAMAAVKLVIKYRLPVSFSSKPDFSDTVDPSTGVSRLRQSKR